MIRLIFVFSILNLSALEVFAFEIIAHRGVHQNFRREGLNNQTCTADRIDPPSHKFLENTLESMKEAFRLGADIVEVDIHPTKEKEGHNIALFHDWTLECRTDADCKSLESCVTHDQSLDYLKTLDIGHGYSHDGGQTFPFRGCCKGAMPSFREALSLMEKYPNKKLLINVKDQFHYTVATAIEQLKSYSADLRNRILFPRYSHSGELTSIGVPDSIYQSGKAKRCLMKYMIWGWLGVVPESCHNLKVFVPVRETLGRFHPSLNRIKLVDILWGWPERFVKRMKASNSSVYASQVDSIEEYDMYRDVGLSGIMTNKIEIIGPHSKK